MEKQNLVARLARFFCFREPHTHPPNPIKCKTSNEISLEKVKNGLKNFILSTNQP